MICPIMDRYQALTKELNSSLSIIDEARIFLLLLSLLITKFVWMIAINSLDDIYDLLDFFVGSNSSKCLILPRTLLVMLG